MSITPCPALSLKREQHGDVLIQSAPKRRVDVQYSWKEQTADIEIVRLRPSNPDDTPPICPEFFDHRYVLPDQHVDCLETHNPHARDARIIFYKDPHIYIVDNFPMHESVSGLSKEFTSNFNSIEAIDAMKRSQRNAWPRLQYVLNARQVHEISSLNGHFYGCMIVDKYTGITLASTNPGIDAAGNILLQILRENGITSINQDDEDWYVFDRVLTDEEICHKWQRHGEDARNRGTEAHFQMELWFNSQPVRNDDVEVQMGLTFIKRSLLPIGAKAFRTEWTIFGDDENIAGCIDLAVVLPDNRLYLIDWKRSQKLQSQMYNDYSKMQNPLHHLDACNGCMYTIQLSCYRYLIEKYYGFTVAGCALVSLHPQGSFVTAVPYLKHEVKFIMERRHAMMKARLLLSKDEAHNDLKCCKSGLTVTQAVRDANNSLYDIKVATLCNLEFYADDVTTKRAQSLFNKAANAVQFDGAPVPWRQLYPRPTESLLFFS